MRILVAPLNWGLGHASRCISLIERLQSDGNEVVLGGDGDIVAAEQGRSAQQRQQPVGFGRFFPLLGAAEQLQRILPAHIDQGFSQQRQESP